MWAKRFQILAASLHVCQYVIFFILYGDYVIRKVYLREKGEWSFHSEDKVPFWSYF